MAQDWTDDVYAGGHTAQTDLQNIENNFAAIKSAFSGVAAPADTVAGMWWYDTTTHILKIRNELNSAWLSVWDLANNKPVIANLSGEITLAMMHADQSDPAAGVAGLRTLGTGATQALPGDTDLGLGNFTAGSYSIGHARTDIALGFQAAYTKLFEFKIKRAGTIYVSQGFVRENSQAGANVYGRIYKNGAAIGTARSAGNPASWVFYRQSFTFAVDDLIQYYYKSDAVLTTHHFFSLEVTNLADCAPLYTCIRPGVGY